MHRTKGNKGIVLIITLATVLIVTVLANIILTVVASNYKITHHKTTRIQAYYAAFAAMNLARDKLRRGEWGTGQYTLNDSDIPYTVNIDIRDEGSNPNFPGVRPIYLSVTYQ